MNKRLMFLILVTLAMLMAATPALAAGPCNQNRHENQNRNRTGAELGVMPGLPVFAVTGIITAVGGDSITLVVYNGNRFAKPYFGQELTVLVTENTRYWQWTPDGYLPIGLGDVQVGDTTSIRGLVSGETFTATRVTIDVPCCTP
jgi:hypothetical protein